MEIGGLLLLASCALMLMYPAGGGATVSLETLDHLQITRQNDGDTFVGSQVEGKECPEETCVGISSGTASAISRNSCICKCHSHLPAFREDLRICVDDIHECALAPFVGGSTSQQIPFVFLPLKGQIIHPSKEISFSGIKTPVCAVSGAKFLTDNGWVDLRNPLDTDVPFRLFRDEGRTFLQWVGESDLRLKMSGRLVMVYLMCRDLESNSQKQTLFSPCVAFRVVGSPTKYLNNVSEVAFLPDAHSSLGASTSDHLSVSEYVAIGISSILLGLIYVASVFFYLHIRRRNAEPKTGSASKILENKALAAVEEGIVKNNPLLSMSPHFPAPDSNNYSDTNSSDTDAGPDIIQHHSDERKKHLQITSALVHPSSSQQKTLSTFSQQLDPPFQEAGNIERLPEENVSIVETLDCRDEHPDTLKAITGTVRKKLYFNPAYFEPQLLLAPPPAALEFLAKIREVITIAKQKMASKKFTPSLLGIPEEESVYSVEPFYELRPSSRRSSIISLKRENSRRSRCSGCPGCQPQDLSSLCGRLPEFPALAACKNCISPQVESKQRSIRKWLEDIPVLKTEEGEVRMPKRLRSPTRSLPPDNSSERALSPRPASDCGHLKLVQKKRRSIKPKAAPPIPTSKQNRKLVEEQRNLIPKEPSLPPPDMIHEAMAVDNESKSSTPTITEMQMKRVVNNFSSVQPLKLDDRQKSDYETDSLERSGKGYRTPSDYAEMSSSQPSPSLSTALPLDEEMTMRNAIFNKNTGNMTISKINMGMLLNEDEHDYELIVLKKGTANLSNLPELLQNNTGYSLISEVYVNNGYNYGSTPTTPSGSNCSTLDKRTLKVRYEECDNKPGKLLIEVEDCPDNYIPVEDSDGFEPDTLDRKPKLKMSKSSAINMNDFVDSLERPHQIQLKTNGSFRSTESIPDRMETENSSGNFNRVFSSLREIYEAKTKNAKFNIKDSSLEDEEGRLLTLEERHSKRQRISSKSKVVQPDVIPPPPHDNSPIYEHPKPPRKIVLTDDNLLKPPLPPKNGNSRSTKDDSKGAPDLFAKNDYEFCLLQKSKDGNIITSLIQSEDIILKKARREHAVYHSTILPTTNLQSEVKKKNFKNSWSVNRPEDSGYLSTDSNESGRKKKKMQQVNSSGIYGSETDESLGDGHSESGAESVETHSVFFGRFHRKPVYGSMDSGIIGIDDNQSISTSDSETVSYTTVVPITHGSKSILD